MPTDHHVLTFLHPVELTARGRAELESVAPGLEIHFVPYREDTQLRSSRAAGAATAAQLASAPTLSDADWARLERTTAAVALDLPELLLVRARSLQWIQTIGAGTDYLDTNAIAAQGITVTNGAGVASASIAEFVLGRLLQIWKRFREVDELQRQRRWDPLFGRSLAGLTLGIVGLGAIGRATARRARAFDMVVVASRRNAVAGATDPDVDQLFAPAQLHQMIKDCDAVVIAAPATPETRGLFNRTTIAAMKPGAVLCNVARGSLVDEDALVDALRSGHLGAAIVDATAQEPTPADSALWTAPNCYLSPHAAVARDGYDNALLNLVIRNLRRLVNRMPLENEVALPSP